MENLGWILTISIFLVFIPGPFLCIYFGRCTIMPYKTKDLENDKNILSTKNTTEWAKVNCFNFVGYYTAKMIGMNTFMAVWKSQEKPTFLCQYNAYDGKKYTVTIDYVTDFKNEIELTTCSKKDAHLFPKPQGIYAQSFSAGGFYELYTKHIEAEEYLIKEGRAQFHDAKISFEESFASYLKRETTNKRKYWYRFFFLPYYYFIRLNKFHDKTIRQQHELEMIQLPDMLLERFE